MNISQVSIFVFLCINATMSGDFLIRFIAEKKPRLRINKYIYNLLFSSVIWSLGMALMSIQKDDFRAYMYRTIGILGTFIFMISVQVSLCVLSCLPKRIQFLFNTIAFLGIPVFVLYSIPGQTIFVHNNIGTTFYFKPGFINDIYALYFVLVSFNILLVTIHTLLSNSQKRVKIAGKRLITVEFCIFFGAIFDMILPSFGIPAFPGSAITHFWGVVIFWFIIHDMYKSELTITNMSQYIYQSLNAPVMIFNSQYQLGIINNALAEFCGIDESTFLPFEIGIADLFNVDNTAFEFEQSYKKIDAVCNSNQAPCEIYVNRINDKYNDNIGYICLVTDQTEHKLAISQLEQAKLAADAANMSKSLFLANMSHEIRTPMNAILGFSEIALMEEIDNKSRGYFQEIKQAGTILLSLINEILNISKIELGNIELNNKTYESEKLIRDVELITRSNANKKDLNLNLIIDEKFPKKLYGDADKIREVLLNILGNSVKYTSHGGIKFICSSIKKNDKDTVLHFEISDTGIGIKEDEIPLIFDKFSRLDPQLNSKTEGTGLGLSITKGLVNLLSGTIDVKSEYGVGTTFIVKIPQQIVEESPELINSSLVQMNTGNTQVSAAGKKYLVVDDTEVNLKVASKLLSKYGADVDACSSGAESIEKCKHTSYDIVFMDHMMPGMDGVEAMNIIRNLPGYEHGSSHKIVVLTANAVDSAREMLIESGFDDFISKPIQKETLEQLITKYM